jgi:hypothetical protein
MKTRAVRVIAMALFSAVAFTGFATGPASASTPAQWLKFSGIYRFHVGTPDGKFSDSSFKIEFSNGSGTDPGHNQIQWSHVGRHFHYTIFPLSEAWFIVGDGIRNRNGLSSRKNPGTYKIIYTNDFHEEPHTWFAVKVRDAPTS